MISIRNLVCAQFVFFLIVCTARPAMAESEATIAGTHGRPTPAMWSHYVIRSHAAPAAMWLASKKYSETTGSGIQLSDGEVELLRTRAGAELAKARSQLPVVERLTLRGGKERIAQTAPGGRDVNLTDLATGEKLVVKQDEIIRREKLDLAAALSALARYYSRQPKSPPVDSLASVASLVLRADNEKVALSATDFAATELLSRIETACACCAGCGEMNCLTCEGNGKVAGRVKCEVCNGLKSVNCFDCRGTRRVDCPVPGCRNGTVKTGEKKKGILTVPVFGPCRNCNRTGKVDCAGCRTGKVACLHCNATGEVDGRTKCTDCGGKKTTKCLACGGAGTRKAMNCDYLALAERDCMDPSAMFDFARARAALERSVEDDRFNEGAGRVLLALGLHGLSMLFQDVGDGSAANFFRIARDAQLTTGIRNHIPQIPELELLPVVSQFTGYLDKLTYAAGKPTEDEFLRSLESVDWHDIDETTARKLVELIRLAHTQRDRNQQ